MQHKHADEWTHTQDQTETATQVKVVWRKKQTEDINRVAEAAADEVMNEGRVKTAIWQARSRVA